MRGSWFWKWGFGKEFPALPMGINGRDDEGMIYWFLMNRKFVADDAFAKLAKAILIRNDNKNLRCLNCLRSQSRRSRPLGRPLCMTILSQAFPQYPLENEKLCVFLIKKELCKLPASKEQILGIFDLRGFGAANADLNILTFMFDVFYYYNPKRLGQVLFVNAPFVFKPLWQIAKPLLRSYASLVRFYSVDEVKSEYFTEETLPPHFRN